MMKNSQIETSPSLKQRGYHFGIILFALLLGLPLLFYYGYCWGLWGRSSLLLQYLFQCNCPVTSEQARYPDGVKVIVSACKYHSSILSPSGRLLYVQEEESRITSTYLLDLQTDEKTLFALPEGSNYFLTDELIFHTLYGSDEYLLDIITGKQYPINRFAQLRSDAYVNGELNVSILAEELRKSKDVFLIDDDNIIALIPDFDKYPERNINIRRGDFPGREANRAEQFLQQYGIAYQRVYQNFVPRFPNEVISQDGKLVARGDGIYSVETGQRIVGRISASRDWAVRGWTYDGSAVIYSYFQNPCVIRSNFGFFDSTLCFLKVPQPVVKLKVPEEYLTPTQTP
jgi:hypothetical protein